MNILSFIWWNGCHDTAAALVRDGELVAAVEEERFTRVKHESAVPFNAIDYCLTAGGLCMADVDLIAFPDKPFRTGPDSKYADADPHVFRELRKHGYLRRRATVHRAALTTYLRLGLPARSWGMGPYMQRALADVTERYGPLPPIAYYHHHEAHAAATYLTSGLDRAAIVTVDGIGEPYSTVTWAAEGTGIRRIQGEAWCNSLGIFYLNCSGYLGMGDFGEGKTMGLASYGDPAALAPAVGTMIREDSGSRWYEVLAEPSPEVVGFPPRTTEAPTDPPYPDFAASTQAVLERVVARIVDSARRDAGCDAACLSGGVAYNCSSNGKLLAAAKAPVWVFCASGDAGLTVGSALLAARDRGELKPVRIDRADWGPEFGDSEIEAALAAESRVAFHRSRSVEEETADLLAASKVVGWMQGRMEFGPRALCHRSILADPRSKSMLDRVNELKGRERWRPLAPVVPAERANEYFELDGESPFMLFATKVRPLARQCAPAIVHVDGTARPQTVRAAQDPRMHRLLAAFERRSGVPVLLNTSFNGPGQPIVCTPADAIETFLERGLDVLVCGDFVATRADAGHG